MGEVVDVVDVRSDFRREEFRIERNLFGPGISIQPCEVGERKRLCFLGLCCTARTFFWRNTGNRTRLGDAKGFPV